MKDKCKTKKQNTEGTRICSVGGQALMEGILMRGPHGMAQVVRDPKGELVIEAEAIQPLSQKNGFLRLPFVRGSVSLVDSMRVGMKALFDSAEICGMEEDPDYQPSKFDTFVEKKLGDKAMGVFMTISMVLAVCLSIGLFFILPNLISSWIIPKESKLLYNLVEGVVRLAIFMGYMIAISKMRDIRRVYMYHGAEHKTIHCYEHEDPLTVENVRKYSKHHPRCGTAFLFVVMFISILIYSVMPRFENIFLNIAMRIVLLPVIAGISYEFNRFAGKNNGKITRILRAPGMAMQHFTTVEPEDDMIEVAIIALEKALEFEKEPVFPSYSALDKEAAPAPEESAADVQAAAAGTVPTSLPS